MKLLNALRLLVAPAAPTSGVAAGAMYFDSVAGGPLYNDGSRWTPFGTYGWPEDITETYVVPTNRQAIYFDRFQNDGVLMIVGTGTVVGIR